MATTGAKYQRDMDTAEIAKRIRADVKAAQKAGTLPASMKVSVRTRRFAGGAAIDVTVTEAPFQIHASDYIAFEVKTRGHQHWDGQRYTLRARQVLEALEAIVAEYNRDDSDSQSDYFNVHFYSHATYDIELTRADREILMDYYRALAAPRLSLVA